MPLAALLAPLLLIAQAQAAEPQTSGVVIFDAAKTKMMLEQCARSTPVAGEAGWKPQAGDIARLEAALPAALARIRAAHPGALDGAPARWIRQYVGIVRGGRRYVYGNFAPGGEMFGKDRWRDEPLIVCDGGVGFFGAEFDVEIGNFTHLDFNGSA
ncbi:hypothetical protein FHS95_000049 [Sphingomonas naasensis]|uniref:DUF4893 domain-containing protein n=1 Tax=Sphingomonas naasensis TaxID=1344951 RepID=A0A4S1WQM0_9SPHN|nr:hypothetical protein [Sphingomonas naasensis]NIJ18380.1 hypothetical protein [Sphingomonas naasensis]TGX45649.1 hypothetical protein E5A74_00245 [Sphingomonas naasensis]